MRCPNDECKSENHRYSGQSDHKYLLFRRVGRRCLDCGLEFIIEQEIVAEEWHRPNPDQSTLDLFPEDTK